VAEIRGDHEEIGRVREILGKYASVMGLSFRRQRSHQNRDDCDIFIAIMASLKSVKEEYQNLNRE